VDGALISNNDVKGDAEAFVRVEGVNSKAVTVKKNKLHSTKKEVELAAGAKQDAAVHAQNVTPLWKDFVEAKNTGKTPVLPDFSYAGYHFSETEIPSVAGVKGCDSFDIKASSLL
jgi:hypothetical protein